MSDPWSNISLNHYRIETFRQRMPANQWRQILLDGCDKIMVAGYLRQLKAKKLGYGVVEVYKEPLDVK